MPINGLTINQEKRIRQERLAGPGVSPTDGHASLAVAIAKYRTMQKSPPWKTTKEQRQAVLAEIDSWLKKLGYAK